MSKYWAEQLKGETVLVTGGTGFTGQHLTRALSEAGAKVRAIARASSNREALAKFPIEWFVGEVDDPDLIARAMDGVTVVFHMATLYRTGDAAEADHYRVHVTSTERLAQAALNQPSFKRFVLVSTVGVHGHIEHPPADESAPIQPGDEYQRTKAQAEQWLNDFAPTHNLPYTIIRPAAIYGPGDQRLLKVFRMARHRWAPILGKRPCLYHLIHVDDLVALLLQAAVDERALGETFIAGNPEPIPLDQMLELIGQSLGRKPRIVKLPVAPFWWLAILCETICPKLGIAPPIYRRRIKFFLNDRSFNTRKIQDKLDFTYAYTSETGLIDTARWYQAHGLL